MRGGRRVITSVRSHTRTHPLTFDRFHCAADNAECQVERQQGSCHQCQFAYKHIPTDFDCAADNAEGRVESIPAPGTEEPQSCCAIYTLQYSTSGQQQTKAALLVCQTSELLQQHCLCVNVWQSYITSVGWQNRPIRLLSCTAVLCLSRLVASSVNLPCNTSKATVPNFYPFPVFQDPVFCESFTLWAGNLQCLSPNLLLFFPCLLHIFLLCSCSRTDGPG